MNEYHKINSIFKRDLVTNKFIENQYATPEFDYLKNNIWVFTEKIDGTNIRVYWDKEKVTLGGRTENAQIPARLIPRLLDIFPAEKLKEMFSDVEVTFYGEGYGSKIQSGGKYIPDGVDFILFDVSIGHWWLKREDIEGIATQLKLQVVPIMGSGTLPQAIELIKKGVKSTFGNFLAEGLVLRPEVELKARNGARIITKLKHVDYGVQLTEASSAVH